MTEVKMPVPNFSSWHIEDHKSLLNPTGLCNAFVGSPDPDKYDRLGYWKDKGCHREPLFTEAQLKQYGDDRAREALEMAEKPKPLNVIARNEINLELTFRQGFDGPDICCLIDLVIDAVEVAHGISKNTPAKEIQ